MMALDACSDGTPILSSCLDKAVDKAVKMKEEHLQAAESDL